jgi:hypothetical protein
MKRTKKETRENYLAMMTEMWRLPRFYLRDMIEKYKVSANIGAALLKATLIDNTMQRGYYEYVDVMPTMSDVEKVLSILKSRNKPAPEVVEVSDAVGVAYPKNSFNDALDKMEIIRAAIMTLEQREQAALNILSDIMRDNQHITYTLKRIEREVKETETNLLK